MTDMRKFIIAIILLLGFLFIIGGRSELEEVSATIKQGIWLFILFAILTQVIWLMVMAFSFKVIYDVIGVEESISGLLPTVLSANFVNIIAPSAGVSGITMLIARARKKGYSTARAMVAGALFVVFDYFGFLCILTVGLFVLFRRNNLTAVEITASTLFGILALIFTILLYLGTQSADALGRALTWMAHQVNKMVRPFIRREYLSIDYARNFAHDAAEGLNDLKRYPKKIVQPMLLAVINKSLLVLVLYFIFMSFKVPVAPGTIVAGFSIGYLFLIISPTPAGLGFVEGSLTLVLNTMYIPLETAAILTLAYRGITFWLPFFIGMAAVRWTGLSQPEEGKINHDENSA